MRAGNCGTGTSNAANDVHRLLATELEWQECPVYAGPQESDGVRKRLKKRSKTAGFVDSTKRSTLSYAHPSLSSCSILCRVMDVMPCTRGALSPRQAIAALHHCKSTSQRQSRGDPRYFSCSFQYAAEIICNGLQCLGGLSGFHQVPQSICISPEKIQKMIFSFMSILVASLSIGNATTQLSRYVEK
jgi:hypothetical protein